MLASVAIWGGGLRGVGWRGGEGLGLLVLRGGGRGCSHVFGYGCSFFEGDIPWIGFAALRAWGMSLLGAICVLDVFGNSAMFMSKMIWAYRWLHTI